MDIMKTNQRIQDAFSIQSTKAIDIPADDEKVFSRGRIETLHHLPLNLRMMKLINDGVVITSRETTKVSKT